MMRSYLAGFVVVIITVGGMWYVMRSNGALVPTVVAPTSLDGFTQCLKDKGAVFYGAFWCPHCQNQKKLFGTSETLLPYVECSTADGKSQLALCREKNIAGYPTWMFVDGTRASGELDLAALATKTGCELPKTQ